MWYVVKMKDGKETGIISKHRTEENAVKNAAKLRLESGFKFKNMRVVEMDVDNGILEYHPAEKEQSKLKQIQNNEAVRVVCIEAANMLVHIREKVPKSPHGAGPDGWLENAIHHLNMIVADAVEREASL